MNRAVHFYFISSSHATTFISFRKAEPRLSSHFFESTISVSSHLLKSCRPRQHCAIICVSSLSPPNRVTLLFHLLKSCRHFRLTPYQAAPQLRLTSDHSLSSHLFKSRRHFSSPCQTPLSFAFRFPPPPPPACRIVSSGFLSQCKVALLFCSHRNQSRHHFASPCHKYRLIAHHQIALPLFHSSMKPCYHFASHHVESHNVTFVWPHQVAPPRFLSQHQSVPPLSSHPVSSHQITAPFFSRHTKTRSIVTRLTPRNLRHYFPLAISSRATKLRLTAPNCNSSFSS
jgi:hypothetical protein